MREIIRELEVDALRSGVSPLDFWTYDFDDLRCQFKAFEKKITEDMKLQISGYYQLANLTATMVGCSFSGKKPPTLSDLYPQLFPVDEKAVLEEKKSQIMAWAQIMNAKTKKEE